MTVESSATLDRNANELICQGDWDLENLEPLKNALDKLPWPSAGSLAINGAGISKMDTAGAWLLLKWFKKLESKGLSPSFEQIPAKTQELLTFIENKMAALKEPALALAPSWLARLGKDAYVQGLELVKYLDFTGRLSIESLRIGFHPKHFRWSAISATIERTGYQALAIIALLSFMIGVVIAYQMGFQLRNYGANVFIVDLLGLSMLREFGPLITAIMVAGRTGSSFTAQLGTMKVNQEIDALSTMGITPAEILLLPRLAGLFIALPLLTIWADIFGILGGMLMANNMLNVTWYDFLVRFQREIPLRALLIGLGKAPVFALIIASIGCFEGIQVEGSADSVGTKTTRSVVLSIFFIIIADAAFSIIFSKLRL